MTQRPNDRSRLLLLCASGALLGLVGHAFQDGPPPGREGQERGPGQGPPGGPGGMFGREVALVERFDKNGDKRLDAAERQAAREFLKKERESAPPERGERGGPGGPGGPGGFQRGRRGNTEPPKPGPKVTPSEVKRFPDAKPYDLGVMRTLFLEFESPDWEAELAEFKNTDVDVPARLTVDGKVIEGVGAHFRGASSFMMVGAGFKRSLNLDLDFTTEDARFGGQRTLNLLNCNGDPSFVRAIVYSTIAQKHMPAPKVNLVKLVINGESWGIYANAQQFNQDMLAEWFKDPRGVRWKVPGSPRGGGGLSYRGDELAAYEREYEIKTKDKEQAERGWKALIRVCKTIAEVPADKLEQELAPIFDVQGALWYLALENALANSDGYWTRASDFSLFLDTQGVLHVIPHDMNECLMAGGGPGRGPGGGPPGGPPQPGEPGAPRTGGGEPRGIVAQEPPAGGPPQGPRGERPQAPGEGGRRGGPGAGGATLDPLAGVNDASKPLLSKLLLVPAWRTQYLRNIRTIAEQDLAPEVIDPLLKRCHQLIAAEVAADTRKLDTLEAFERSFAADEPASATPPAEGEERRGPGLAQLIRARRAFLLGHAALKDLPPAKAGPSGK